MSCISDGSGSHAQYRAEDADGVDQNTMFISMFCAVRIHAEWTDDDGNFHKIILWENLMANSPYSHSPLRMKYCKESKGRPRIRLHIISSYHSFKFIYRGN